MKEIDSNKMSQFSGGGVVGDWLCGTDAGLVMACIGSMFGAAPVASFGLGVAFGCWAREHYS